MGFQGSLSDPCCLISFRRTSLSRRFASITGMALRFRSYQTKRSTTVSPLQTATRLARASRKNLGCRYQRMPAIGPEVDASWSLSMIRLSPRQRSFVVKPRATTSGTKFTRRLGKSPVVPGDLKAMPPRLLDGCR